MAGPRIRTLKPEWLEDEQLLRAGSHARVLSVALILVADDYGRGRCIPEALAAQVFPFEPESSRVFRESLARLSEMHFCCVYRVRDQQYFQIRNWTKHQRVDKPGKPRVPAPDASDYIELESSGESREPFANHSRESRETLAPDRDRDLDQEQERRGRAIRLPGSSGRATGGGRDSTAAAATADSPNGTNGEAAKRVEAEDVARAWAETIGKPGANPDTLHALDSWRAKFQTIAAACNAVDGQPAIAMHAVIEWFWFAPDGPVQGGRVPRAKASPTQLARLVSQDLKAAKVWWFKQREASKPRSHEATQ